MQRLREQGGVRAESAAENNIAALRDVQTWLERLEHHLLGMRRDLRIFAPWTERLASPPSGCAEIAARVAALMTYGMTSPVGAGEAQALDALDAFSRDAVPDAVRDWLPDLRAAIADVRPAAQDISDRLGSPETSATTPPHEMDLW